MRHKLSKELEIREAVDEAIKQSVETSRIVYFSPSSVSCLLFDKQGLRVSRQYIARRYEELGIVCENGLWVKDVE